MCTALKSRYTKLFWKCWSLRVFDWDLLQSNSDFGYDRKTAEKINSKATFWGRTKNNLYPVPTQLKKKTSELKN